MKALAFEQLAALEREHWWFRGRRHVYMALLRDIFESAQPARLLDVGAGVGGFLQELATLGGIVHFTETNAQAMRHCRERGGPLGVRADATHLPFAAASFELVTLFDVLEHVEDDRCALLDVRRLLTSRGVVMISVPAHPLLFSRNDVVAEHHRRYTRRGLRELLESCDMEVLRLSYANCLLFPGIAAFLLACRGLERLGVSAPQRERTNLSWTLPRALNELAYSVFSAESLISRRWDLPLGHSLVALARRRVP